MTDPAPEQKQTQETPPVMQTNDMSDEQQSAYNDLKKQFTPDTFHTYFAHTAELTKENKKIKDALEESQRELTQIKDRDAEKTNKITQKLEELGKACGFAEMEYLEKIRKGETVPMVEMLRNTLKFAKLATQETDAMIDQERATKKRKIAPSSSDNAKGTDGDILKQFVANTFEKLQ